MLIFKNSLARMLSVIMKNLQVIHPEVFSLPVVTYNVTVTQKSRTFDFYENYYVTPHSRINSYFSHSPPPIAYEYVLVNSYSPGYILMHQTISSLLELDCCTSFLIVRGGINTLFCK